MRVRLINYSEFFQKFYFTRSDGGLVGAKSKLKIPKFFVENALDRDYWEKLPSDSAYEKWFDGGNKGHNVKDTWELLNNHFDSSALLKKLRSDLNETKLKELMARFDIDLKMSSPDKEQFANAIVIQFKAIAAGNGIAENVVPDEYIKRTASSYNSDYPFKAKQKFQKIKLPGEDEFMLDEFYVCNNIGTREVVFPHKNRGGIIENVTLDKLRTYDERGATNYVLLIGACGYGKTTMMQHLFVDAVNQCTKMGLFPVFAELRNFKKRHTDLLSFIVEVVNEYDAGFDSVTAESILNKGKMQILFDGLDEMDPEENKGFQKALSAFCVNYSKNQIVISSRHCSAIKGIRLFQRLFIQPLDEKQVGLLISKLLKDETEERNRIISAFVSKSTYINKNGFVATNPMLLTIIVRHFDEFMATEGDKAKFYELLYQMLITQHDEEKEAFGRFFHSVSDGDEFTLAYREFCAKSYIDGVYEFNKRSFEKYYRQIKSKSQFFNPNKFKLTAFQNDVCATACMMYEQDSGIYYIDPGFQDYFFAEFYYQEESEQTRKMGLDLWHRDTNSFRNIDALKMLYGMTKDKVDVCIFLPFLKEIFRGKTEDENFLRFLHYSFGSIAYTLFDDTKIQRYIKKKGNDGFDFVPAVNYTKNVVAGLLFDILGEPNTLIVGSFDEHISMQNATGFYIGYYDLINRDDSEHTRLFGARQDIAEYQDLQHIEDVRFPPAPLLDSTGRLECLGYEYRTDPMLLIKESEERDSFLDLCKSTKIFGSFQRFKEYYFEILEEQKHNKYK